MAKNRVQIEEIYGQARQLERDGDLPAAAELYEKVLKGENEHTDAFNRLMIIYRKQKEYRKELATINKAISVAEEAIKTQQQQWAKGNKKATTLSRQLARDLGLLDRKGLPLHEDENLARWRKRKETVQKRLKK